MGSNYLPTPACPSGLIKVTVGYCSSQDRVRMDGVDELGRVIRLWFTARLLTRLVSHLRSGFELYSAQTGCTDLVDVDQDFRADGSTESISVNFICGKEVLLSSVDVRSLADYRELTFKGPNGEAEATLLLHLQPLEKLLWGLKQCFESAEWPLSPFTVEAHNECAAHEALPTTIH